MLSVLTACNRPAFLPHAYQSLCEQSHQDWEWVVVLNNDGLRAELSFAAGDNRVRAINDSAPTRNIGYWKRRAALEARGDIFVELDQDDRLMPSALDRLQRAFDQSPAVGMVYSNNAAVLQNWAPNVDYGADYGWEYREREAYGHQVRECLSPTPLPQNLAMIWYAPDHVRAWRASAYWDAGGHDPMMAVADDHDLTCRLYLSSELQHIDDLLYIYTVHGENNTQLSNAEIQQAQWGVYHRYIERLALRWASQEGLRALDLGGAISPRPGFESVDLHDAAVLADLSGRWPFEDNSIGVVRAADILEHLPSPLHAMNELWRVLAHGGFAFISVPSTDGRGAWQDPTHRSFWNENSFWYYTKRAYQVYIEHAGAKARFQKLFLETRFPSEFHRAANIPYVEAHLLALKHGPRFHGLVEI